MKLLEDNDQLPLVKIIIFFVGFAILAATLAGSLPVVYIKMTGLVVATFYSVDVLKASNKDRRGIIFVLACIWLVAEAVPAGLFLKTSSVAAVVGIVVGLFNQSSRSYMYAIVKDNIFKILLGGQMIAFVFMIYEMSLTDIGVVTKINPESNQTNHWRLWLVVIFLLKQIHIFIKGMIEENRLNKWGGAGLTLVCLVILILYIPIF